MPVTDWLEEILNAAEEPGELETAVEWLTPLLNRVGTGLPGRAEAVHGEGPEAETAAVRRGQTRLDVSGGERQAQEAAADPRRGGAESALELYRRSVTPPLYARRSELSALQGLYRQVRETVGGEPASAGSRVNTVVVREEGPAAAPFSMGEFDRAVRRDSRRYDSGMSIY